MADFYSLMQSTQGQEYILVFILMILEGPIVTAAAAFAASLGIFNIWIILLFSIFGNLVPDTFLYFIGRNLRGGRIEKCIYSLGFTKARIKRLEKNLREHARKTLVMVKLTPGFPIPGLVLAGFTRIPFSKFFKTVILFNLIASVIFTAIGFYSGMAANSIMRYLRIGEYALLLVIPLVVFLYYSYKKFTNKLKIKNN